MARRIAAIIATVAGCSRSSFLRINPSEFLKNKNQLIFIHCKNFSKRYAWLSVTFLDFISFEQVTGNIRVFSLKLS